MCILYIYKSTSTLPSACILFLLVPTIFYITCYIVEWRIVDPISDHGLIEDITRTVSFPWS